MATETMVRMGELVVTNEPSAILTGLGLGSCIGICAFDPKTKVIGMAHVVLPSSMGKAEGLPAKSADIGVPNLIKSMVDAGANLRNIRVAIAGGAQLFSFAGASTNMDVGDRNATAVTTLLKSLGVRLVATDVGGNTGRTVKLLADGKVTVRKVGQPEKCLAELAQ